VKESSSTTNYQHRAIQASIWIFDNVPGFQAKTGHSYKRMQTDRSKRYALSAAADAWRYVAFSIEAN